MIIVKTFLPVIVLAILRIITIEQNIAFKTMGGGGYTKISGSSDATIFSSNTYRWQCIDQQAVTFR